MIPANLDVNDYTPLECSFKGTLTHIESTALRDAIKKLREERRRNELMDASSCEEPPPATSPLPSKYVLLVLGMLAFIAFEMVYLFV